MYEPRLGNNDMALKVLISKQNLLSGERNPLYSPKCNQHSEWRFSSFWVEIKRKISDPIEFLQFHGALTCSIYTRIPLELVCFVSMHILDRKCYTDFMEDFLKIHSF